MMQTIVDWINRQYVEIEMSWGIAAILATGVCVIVVLKLLNGATR